MREITVREGTEGRGEGVDHDLIVLRLLGQQRLGHFYIMHVGKRPTGANRPAVA